MKRCYKCGCEKSFEFFGKNVSKVDGLASECKECKRKQDKEYSKKNAARIRQRASDWYYNNRSKEEFIKVSKQRLKDWRSRNLDKHAAKENKRRALKLRAMPKWLSEEQLKAITTEYALSKWCSEVMGTKYHVDHIVPLKGKQVCGLHVPWNLRVIPAKENIIKGNRYVG